MKKSKIISYLIVLLGLFGSLASIYTWYDYYIKSKKGLVLDIKTIFNNKVAEGLNEINIDILHHGDTLDNLWETRFVLSNTGNVTLVGKGGEPNNILDTLFLYAPNNSKVLDLKVIRKSPKFEIEVIKKNNQEYILDFYQWKEGEFIEIASYLEKIDDNSYNNELFTLKESVVLNGNVTESLLSVEENLKTHFIDTLSPRWKKILKICTYLVYLLFLIFATNGSLTIFQKINDEYGYWGSLLILCVFIGLILLFVSPLLWTIEI